MLKLRPIGQNDYSVQEDDQRIGRIRYAKERSPGVWMWQIHVHIPGAPVGSSRDLDKAKSDFKAAWASFKVRHGPEKLAAAYKAMNIHSD